MTRKELGNMDDRTSMSESGRRSPLQHLHQRFLQVSAEPAIMLREASFRTQINLRGDPDNASFLEAVHDVLGFDIPQRPNSSSISSSVAALWLGPNEWLLVHESDIKESVFPPLTRALAGLHSSVTDVSHSRTIIELSGNRSGSLLAKGCSLDLNPRSFHPGDCAQSNLAKAEVILQLLNGAPTWLIYVRNSFAGYLASWLLDAAAEFYLPN
jgi:sarcosine oxidase, subunit gamma